LLDILNTVPLFTQDGNYFRWSHKSLQGYFAAQFIYLDSKERQNIILSKLYNHTNLEKFINLLDLYYDMDYKAFRNIIEYNLLKEYSTFERPIYSDTHDGITKEEIIRRKELLFLNDSYLFEAKHEDGKHPFANDKLNIMLDKFTKDLKFAENRFPGILVLPPKSQNCYVIHHQSTKFSVLLLLLNKKNSIVSEIKNDNNNGKIELDFNFEGEFQLVKISYEKDNKLNSKNNFKRVNRILERTRIEPVTINHFSALEQLEIIEKSLAQEDDNDFLLEGI